MDRIQTSICAHLKAHVAMPNSCEFLNPRDVLTVLRAKSLKTSKIAKIEEILSKLATPPNLMTGNRMALVLFKSIHWFMHSTRSKFGAIPENLNFASNRGGLPYPLMKNVEIFWKCDAPP